MQTFGEHSASQTTRRRIQVLGTRGGVGTSTVAALVAGLFMGKPTTSATVVDLSPTQGQRRIWHTEEDMKFPVYGDREHVEIVDAGLLCTHDGTWATTDALVVVCGRDYHSVSMLSEWRDSFAPEEIHLVVTGDENRPLTIRDVVDGGAVGWTPTSVTDFATSVPLSRAMDAGLLTSKRMDYLPGSFVEAVRSATVAA